MKTTAIYIPVILCTLLLSLAACSSLPANETSLEDTMVSSSSKSDSTAPESITEPEPEPSSEPAVKMTYLGHASVKFVSKDGTVVYVDPATPPTGVGYEQPADIVLITHNHSDHNNLKLVTQKDDCTVITSKEALADGIYKIFSVNGIEIEAVEAYNQNHNKLFCVGYIITIDGVKIYFAGDTSKTEQMPALAERELDYALLPCDGNYNMDVNEAAECAELIGAKHNIPIHTKNGELFNREVAEGFDAPNRLIVEAGEEITLEASAG